MSDRIKTLHPPDSHHLQAAVGWLELGNAFEAGEELEKIASTLRFHPEVLQVRLEVHSEIKSWKVASEAASALIERDPGNPSYWLSLAYATRRMTGGGIPQAREILARAHLSFPKESLIAYNLACYECQLGDLDEARKRLAKAFEIGNAKHLKAMALKDADLKILWGEIGPD